MAYFDIGSYPEFLAPLTPCNAAMRRCPVSREKASHRILIMRVIANGDIVMGTPLLAALRAAYPEAHLTWMVESSLHDTIDANPFVDSILSWEGLYWKRMMRRAMYPLWLTKALKFRRELRERRFDTFISFHPEDWSLLVQNVGASTRIGVFDTFRAFHRSTKTSSLRRFYTHAFTFEDLPVHRTDQYLLPLRALGLEEGVSRKAVVGYTAADRKRVQDFLQQEGVEAGPRRAERLVVLAPLAGWKTRHWPGERYAELGDRLGEVGCRIVLMGAGKEEADLQKIAARMRVPPILAVGVFNFRQVFSLIEEADLLVSGDTGPMHVAGAVDTPYVALFGSTPIEGRAPIVGHGLPMAHSVDCAPCDRDVCAFAETDAAYKCMRLLTVEEVFEASLSLLDSARSGLEGRVSRSQTSV
ncbi:MAG: glycosyltransferase family 9 protein [Cytophagales bacterium]|nr:glycosyltransferase family 9 protein [Armatimonadota bacterium]